MNVIEVGRILETEEKACVAMTIVWVSAQYLDIKLEVTDDRLLSPGNIQRATVWWLVVAAFLELTVNMSLLCLFYFPG